MVKKDIQSIKVRKTFKNEKAYCLKARFRFNRLKRGTLKNI